MLEIRYHEQQDGVQDAYDLIYDEDPIHHNDSLYRWILRHLDPKPGESLIDIACGEGAIPALAAQDGIIAHGFDLSFSAIKTGRQHYPNLIVANGEDLPYPDDSFNYVTNIGSLEHYMNPAKGVQEMSRILAPKGTACVLVPNTFSVALIVHAWHNGRTIDDGQPIQRYAARYEWQDLLETNGLHVFKTIKYDLVWPRSWQDAKSFLRRPKQIAWLFLGLITPLNLANSFVYLCEKQP